MQHMNLRRTLSAVTLSGGTIVAASVLTQSQGGNAGYGMMGGYGGIWMLALLVIVVAGLVAWVVASNPLFPDLKGAESCTDSAPT